MKRHILLVDPDTRGRRMLEVSLRKAGYTVDPVDDAEAALHVIQQGNADLVLTDTDLPGMSGFELVEKVRADQPGMGIMFLSSDTSLKSKVRGLELGVDYLSKPAYLKEVITRVELELDRRERLRFADRGVPSSSALFKGSLADMALVDLFQTISMGRKSGELFLRNHRQNGSVWFRDGDVVDAECKGLDDPKRALLRFFLWPEGHFELRLGEVDRPTTIEDPTSALIGDGMRRLDEWGRLLEQVPSLETKLHVNANELLQWLAGLPEELNPLLRRLDGETSLGDVIFFAQGDEIELLQRICDLYFEGVLSEYPAAVSIVPSEMSDAPAKEALNTLAPFESLPTSRPPAPSASQMPLGATTMDYLEALEIDLSAGGLGASDEAVPDPTPAVTTPDQSLTDTSDQATNKHVVEDDSDGDTIRGRTLRPAPVVSVPAPAPTTDNRVVHFPGAPRMPLLSTADGVRGAAHDFDDMHDEETSPSIPARGRASMPSISSDHERTREHNQVDLALDSDDEIGTEADIDPARASLSAQGVRSRVRTDPPGPMPTNAAAAESPSALSETEQEHEDRETTIDLTSELDAQERLAEQDLHKLENKPEAEVVPNIEEPSVDEPSVDEPSVDEPSVDEPSVEDRSGATQGTGDAELDALAESKEEEDFFSDPPEEPPKPDSAWEEPEGPRDKQIIPMLFVGAVVLGILVLFFNMSGDDDRSDRTGSDVTREGIASASGDQAKLQGVPAQAEPGEAQAEPDEAQAEPGEAQAEPDEAQAEPDEAQAEPDEAQAEPDEAQTAGGGSYPELLAQAQALHKQHKRKEAEATYRQAIESNPQGSEALADLSLMLLERNRLREAGELAERSVNIDPTNSKGWVVFGAALQSQGQNGAAMGAYRKCAQLGTGEYVIECKRMAR